jgi:Acetyltransferase (GNAT) domain
MPQADSLIVTSAARPSSAQEWDQAVLCSRDAWLYHLSDVASVDFWSLWSAPHFLECRNNGSLIGGALLTHGTSKWHSTSLGPLGRRTARTFVGNLLTGPFVIDGLSKRLTERVRHLLFEELLGKARALGCEELWLGDAPQSQATISRTTPVNRYVLSGGWENCQRYHYFVDLRTDEGARWDDLKQERRTSIRRARNAGVTVLTGSELSNPEDHFVALMTGLDPVRALTPEKLRSIWAALYADARHGQAFFALEDGTPRAFACVPAMGKVASYHLGARSAAATSGAHALALWEAICWAAREGYEWFDVGRAVTELEGSEQDQKERGISRFKEGFGGEIIAVDLAVRHDLRPLRGRTLDLVWAVGRSVERRVRGTSRPDMEPNRF